MKKPSSSRSLRKQFQHNYFIICVIKAHGGYSVEGKATDIMNRGCNGFIQKPYTIEAISKKIKSTMKKRMDRICHENHESAHKNESGKGIMD